MSIFEVGKFYKTRGGDDARVICVDSDSPRYPIVAIINGVPQTYTVKGEFYPNSGEHNALDLLQQTGVMAKMSMFEVGKIYKTRNGDDARVICVDAENEDLPIVALIDGDPFTFTNTGKYYSDEDLHDYDLQLATSPYAHLKMDDLVWVREDRDEDWIPRYFSSLDQDGRVRTFPGGTTSLTTPACSAPDGWPLCWPHPDKPE